MSTLKNYTIRQPKGLNLSLFVEEKLLLIEGVKKRFYYPLKSSGIRGLYYNAQERKIWLLDSKEKSKAFFSLSKILLGQVFLGVLSSYRCQLNIVGIGYQVHIENQGKNNLLVLKLGYSHLVRLQVPNFLHIVCPKPRVLIIEGMNLQQVNNFAQIVRRCRFPSSYKEKGIYFVGEPIKLKQGKKT